VKIDSEIMSKDFCFQVINRNRTFYVHADNKRNMDKWIVAIRECISGTREW
jgi:PH domain